MFKKIKRINWGATIGINYRVGGMRAVWRMPVKVYGQLKWRISGEVILPADAVRNTLVIGSPHEDYSASSGKAELNIGGTLLVRGKVNIGVDCFVGIIPGGRVEIGDGVFLGRDSQIHCYKHIVIGNGVFAGETYISDSSAHVIVDNGVAKARDGEVIIGDGSYLGFRTMLLKGCVVPPQSVIASAAVCCRDYSKQGEKQLFIAGIPADVRKSGVKAIY